MRAFNRLFTGGVVAFIACVFSFVFLGDSACTGVQYPADRVEQVARREIAVAEALGFQRVEQEYGERGASERRWLILERDQCVAVVAGTSGMLVADALVLRPRDATQQHDDWARHQAFQSPVHHVQVCTREPVELIAELDFPYGSGYRTRTWWTVLSAPAARIGGNAALNRGWVPRDDVPPQTEPTAPAALSTP
jgi:hypothetical protein